MILKLRLRKSLTHVYRLLVLFVLISAVFVFVCSCGLSDWDYDLPNGYYVARGNYKWIFLAYANSDGLGGTITPPEKYVSYFAYNEVYIVAQTVMLPEEIEPDEIETFLRHAKITYYVVNSETREVYEQLTEEEYETLISELQITNLCDWIPTITKPKGAWT